MKVFVNGAWLGVVNDAIALYNDLKKKKYNGIINIYTSITFNQSSMEIRICSDGGRLTRPVLRVTNNKLNIDIDTHNKISEKRIAMG